MLLHPLPFPKPNELVAVWSRVSRDNSGKETESIPDYTDLHAALIATYFPARRAMAVDATVALRYE